MQDETKMAIAEKICRCCGEKTTSIIVCTSCGVVNP